MACKAVDGRAMLYLGSSRVAGFWYLNICLAVVIPTIFLGESLGFYSFIGGILMLIGVVFLEFYRGGGH